MPHFKNLENPEKLLTGRHCGGRTAEAAARGWTRQPAALTSGLAPLSLLKALRDASTKKQAHLLN